MAAAVAQVPANGTFLDTFKRSFVDVPIDKDNGNAISTSEFLEAAESVTSIFDVLGSVAFSPVKSDMMGNIKKIRDRQLAAPLDSMTLQDLCRNELKVNQHTATEGLVWLIRGLDFLYSGLSQNVKETSEELAVSFRSSYSQTLKPHHSFFVKPIITAAMSAVPYRKDFYNLLGSDQIKLMAQMETYLAALRIIVDILKAFLASKEAQWK